MPPAPARSDENRSAWAVGKAPYSPTASLARDLDVDVAIVGGGYTGVSTAWHLSDRFPDRRIALIEAGELGSGATGRSGGMMLNWVNGVEHDDPERARRIYDATRGGIDGVEEIIRRHALPVRWRRDGCLEVFTDPRRAESAAREAERLAVAGVPVRWLDRGELSLRLRLEGAHGALFDPTAGQLDGIDYVRAMRGLLLSRGVEVYEDTRVTSVEEGATCTLLTPRARVRARALVLATNACTGALGYFRDGIFPLHSHVIATEPLSPERWAELGWRKVAGFSDDLDRIAYGSVTPRGELVFGGGSNAAYAYSFGGRTSFSGDGRRGFEAVHRRMLRYLPAAADVRVAHRWTGTIGVTFSRVCTMGVRGEHRNVYFALGYSGHGVTLSNLAGRVLADLYCGDDARWRDLPFFQQRLLPIPPEPFRWIGYHVYAALTGRSPRRRL